MRVGRWLHWSVCQGWEDLRGEGSSGALSRGKPSSTPRMQIVESARSPQNSVIAMHTIYCLCCHWMLCGSTRWQCQISSRTPSYSPQKTVQRREMCAVLFWNCRSS